MQDFDDKKSRREEGFLSSLGSAFSSQLEKRKEEPALLFFDLGVLLIGFLFARCHVIFGARPLALGLLALLPVKVFGTLIGAVIGALSLGGAGTVYSVIYILLVALRIIISGSVSSEEKVFAEGLALRMCEGAIAGFVAGAYQLLLTGITLSGVLFALSMIIIPPIVTFALSGIFDTEITLQEFFKGSRELLSLKGRSERSKYAVIFFQCSVTLFSLLIALSLFEFHIFGFSFAYIYVGAVTVFCSKRFGTIRAAAVGFVSALPLSSSSAVAFALSGLASGILFSFGIAWGIGAGAIALVGWSAYTGGAMGILATLPEYSVGAALIAPFLNKAAITTESEENPPSEDAGDMVGTMALAYKNRPSASLDALEYALVGISLAARSFDSNNTVREDEYMELIKSVADEYEVFGAERVRELYINKSGVISAKLKRGEGFSAAMLGVSADEQLYAEEIAALITQKAAKLEEERYKQSLSAGEYEDYKLISKLINETRAREERERELDPELSHSLAEMFERCGFPDGVIKIFGDRRKHVIAAGEDADGSLITSSDIKEGIEKLSDVSLGEAEYFRRGKMVLMESEAKRRYAVECAEASIAGSSGEISGDLSTSFESNDDYFYSLISDGMGSGELARQTSEFVSEFLSQTLNSGALCDTMLHILNHIIRRRAEECSATVDLFEFDLMRGDAVFIKSGAAPSYIKRDSSIFRIRSETAPIGLMKNIDTERVHVEIKSDDYVIMLSDGVSSSPEDAPWLLELLAEPPKRNLKEYAEYILSSAVKNSRSGDDMTVVVAKIKQVA